MAVMPPALVQAAAVAARVTLLMEIEIPTAAMRLGRRRGRIIQVVPIMVFLGVQAAVEGAGAAII
jgi:hypothetical protein